ncbi:MAG: flippase-like domain-containing protein [Firmicutes bacterium]|nr:flippase-like domain-containing protein [Bacillota bacterium]
MNKRVLLVSFGIAAVLFLLWRTDFSTLGTVLFSFNPNTLLLLCLLQLLTIVLIARQWQLIISAAGSSLDMTAVMGILMAGTFVETVTPAVKAGGEAVKTVLLRDKAGITLAEAGAITAAQKTLSLIGFSCLALLSTGHVLFTVGTLSSLRQPILAGLLFLAMLLLLLISLVFRPTLFSRFLPARLHSGITRYQQTIKRMCVRPQWLAGQLMLALLIWMLFAAKTIIIGTNLGLEVTAFQAASVTYISYMLGMVPLLPGGLGTVEASMTAGLSAFGIPAAFGLAAALILRLVSFWFVFLLSAIWLLAQRLRPVFSYADSK